MRVTNGNGFWRLEHADLAAALGRTDLCRESFRVYLAVADLTHGRAKPSKVVSVSEIAELANVTRRHVDRCLKDLCRRGLYGQEIVKDREVRRWVVWPAPPIASRGDITQRGDIACGGDGGIASGGVKVSPGEATHIRQDKRRRVRTHTSTRFTPPTPDEVTAYAKSIGFDLDGNRFVDNYQSKGWMIGKTRMKDWRAAVRNWKDRDREKGQTVSDKAAGSVPSFQDLNAWGCEESEAAELLRGVANA